jgi:hypothetical protein
LIAMRVFWHITAQDFAMDESLTPSSPPLAKALKAQGPGAGGLD